MSKTDPFWKITAWLFIAVVMAGILATIKIKDDRAEMRLYCDMVKKHRKDPETGWPDYKGEFLSRCVRPKRLPACVMHGGASNPQCSS